MYDKVQVYFYIDRVHNHATHIVHRPGHTPSCGAFEALEDAFELISSWAQMEPKAEVYIFEHRAGRQGVQVYDQNGTPTVRLDTMPGSGKRSVCSR